MSDPGPCAPPSPTPDTTQRGQAPLPGDAGRQGCDVQTVWSQGARLSWVPSECVWVMT